ncbi:MAG TPA: ABC transporter permease [Terriglobales bacterium]|jgi:predicted permease
MSEECRKVHRVHWFDELSRDLRYGIRTLGKSPGFAGTAIVSLALGLGVNTLVFSVFDSLFLRPLPVRDPERVRFVETPEGPSNSFPTYRDLRDNNSAFSGLAGYRIDPMGLESGGRSTRIWGYLATGNYFDVLGIKPALGRFFHQEDDQSAGASPYAVLSYNSWQARFGGDPKIVGQTVRINGLRYNVLGVAPPGFHGTELFYWPEVWVPMMMEQQIEPGNAWLNERHTWNTWILGRLKPGITDAAAAADLNRIASGLARRFPDSDQALRLRLAQVGLVGSAMRGPVHEFTAGVLLLAALVLLAACSNLAGLMLARGGDRQREMAIRLSIGAGRGRIMRQLLTESLMLAAAGGIAGCALAMALSRLLSQWHAPVDFPVQFEIGADWRLFLFAVVASITTGILFGFGPALQLSRADINTVLKGGSGIAVFRRFRLSFRDVLVLGEVSLCFVLVFGCALSLRGLQRALNLQIGFQPQGVTTVAFDLGLAGYSEPRGRAFQERVLEAVRTLPGVTSAAYANSLPLSIDQSTTGVQTAGQPVLNGRNAIGANYYDISPGLLSTLEIPLLSGRDFTRHDDQHARQVAIVNETFARTIMRTENPVGKTFRSAFGGPVIEVVGFVRDGKYMSLTESPRPALFRSSYQWYNPTTTLVVRSSLPSVEVVQQIRKTIAALDPHLPLYGAGSLADMLGFALFPMHAAAIALSAFGALALLLAVTGIHGLVSYAVARRTREFGIRIAVGAPSSAVLSLVLGRLISLMLAGLVIGAALSFAAGRILAAVIYEASPRDPSLFLTVIILLALAATMSCWTPVIRALRTNPVTALRYE